MVEAAFRNKNYPYFISMHSKGSEVKINLCSTTIQWHLKYHATQPNQGKLHRSSHGQNCRRIQERAQPHI